MAHEVCSKFLNGYARWPWIDIPMHLLGGIAIALFASGLVHALVEHAVIRKLEWIVHAALVFTAACTAAVFWEFAEWIADHTIGTNAQMNDLNDTMLDLALGVVGAAMGALSPWPYSRRENGLRESGAFTESTVSKGPSIARQK